DSQTNFFGHVAPGQAKWHDGVTIASPDFRPLARTYPDLPGSSDPRHWFPPGLRSRCLPLTGIRARTAFGATRPLLPLRICETRRLGRVTRWGKPDWTRVRRGRDSGAVGWWQVRAG